MQHLLTLRDLTSEQITNILAIASQLKQQVAKGERAPLFQHKVLGLLFEKPSLRTRVSFQSLMSQHGGDSLYLGDDVGWQTREPTCDFMPILTSYLDVLVIRAKSHHSVVEAAQYSQCPIINGLTDLAHPCQALADFLTMQEHLGVESQSADQSAWKVAYVGDANNVAYSLAVICAKLGVTCTIAAPQGYQFGSDFLQSLPEGFVTQTSDPRAAVSGAQFVYTDVWTSMGQEAESAQRLRDFRGFQVTPELMQLAEPRAGFLHCLPARRGEEVAAAVIDGPHSLVIAQAANRLHAQKGLVAWLLEQNK